MVFLFCLMLQSAVSWGVLESTTTVLESTSSLEAPEQETTSAEESESKDILPPNADILISTQPITPISIFPEKAPYDQARDELAQALDLWRAGHAEAASDTALEAYDDFLGIHRVPGVKRSTIRALMHQAAEVYVEGGIVCIKNFVRRAGATPEAIEEGRSRLEDLRDVARNYSELNKMLNSAIEQFRRTFRGPP